MIAALVLAALAFAQPPPGWTPNADDGHFWNKDSSADTEQFGAVRDVGSKLTSRQFAESTIAMTGSLRANYHVVSRTPKTMCGVAGYEVDATFEIDVTPWTEESIYVMTPAAAYLTTYLRPSSHPEDPDAIKALNSLCPPAVHHK